MSDTSRSYNLGRKTPEEIQAIGEIMEVIVERTKQSRERNRQQMKELAASRQFQKWLLITRQKFDIPPSGLAVDLEDGTPRNTQDGTLVKVRNPEFVSDLTAALEEFDLDENFFNILEHYVVYNDFYHAQSNFEIKIDLTKRAEVNVKLFDGTDTVERRASVDMAHAIQNFMRPKKKRRIRPSTDEKLDALTTFAGKIRETLDGKSGEEKKALQKNRKQRERARKMVKKLDGSQSP